MARFDNKKVWYAHYLLGSNRIKGKMMIMVFIWRRFDPLIHHRQSIRLKGYDYCSFGLYYITMRIQPGGPVLCQILNGQAELNEFGNIVDDEWCKTPIIRPYVFIDAYVIMPDHFHGIIGIIDPPTVGATRRVAPDGPFPENDVAPDGPFPENDVAPDGPFPENDTVGATRRVAPTNRPNGPPSGSVGAIIGQFKSQTTKRINLLRNEMGGQKRIWQRNFYDHIIRDQKSLDRIRQYIIDNPSRCT